MVANFNSRIGAQPHISCQARALRDRDLRSHRCALPVTTQISLHLDWSYGLPWANPWQQGLVRMAYPSLPLASTCWSSAVCGGREPVLANIKGHLCNSNWITSTCTLCRKKALCLALWCHHHKPSLRKKWMVCDLKTDSEDRPSLGTLILSMHYLTAPPTYFLIMSKWKEEIFLRLSNFWLGVIFWTMDSQVRRDFRKKRRSLTNQCHNLLGAVPNVLFQLLPSTRVVWG